MKTKTIELYEFSELPEDVRSKVLDNNRHINVEGSWWYESTFEDWRERLTAEGFENSVINFSGFGSQGDGASFTCDRVDVEKFTEANKAKTRFKALLRLIETGDLSASVIRTTHHYSHENTVRGEVEMAWNNETGKLSILGSELENFITERVRQLSKQIYRDLESEYDYLTSDEAVQDTIESNGYTFRASGSMENV